MNTLVIYDTTFGNTEKIAQSMGETVHATVKKVQKMTLSQLHNFDHIIVGSPVHGGLATPEIDSFLYSIPFYGLRGVKVAAFDTRFSPDDHGLGIRFLMSLIRYASPRIASVLTEKGGKLVVKPEGFIVNEKEGPLKIGELERAKDWARTVTSYD